MLSEIVSEIVGGAGITGPLALVDGGLVLGCGGVGRGGTGGSKMITSRMSGFGDGAAVNPVARTASAMSAR